VNALLGELGEDERCSFLGLGEPDGCVWVCGGWRTREEAENRLARSGLCEKLPGTRVEEQKAFFLAACGGHIRSESPDAERVAYVKVVESKYGAENSIMLLETETGKEEMLVPAVNNW
jgi:hypothetical protein